MRSRARGVRYGPAILVVVLVMAMAGPALARSGGPIQSDLPPMTERDGVGERYLDDLWFVEFSEPPQTSGGSAAVQARERADARAQARAQGVPFEPEREFGRLWNGVSLRANPQEIAAIRALDEVVEVYPVAVIEAPDPQEAPALENALAMTGSDVAQSELGLSGEGLSVAIIDTGIDYNHPDLGGDGDPDRTYTATSEEDRSLTDSDGQSHPRISHGWDYVGEVFDASDPNSPPPAPDEDPMDHQGHGTHVAGITGADADDDDGVTGVAPGVTFGAYKVFALGSTTADVIVDALEDAHADGMDIVNMSLGASFVWGQEYPTTQVSNELANDGVVVVNSAGNSGADGAWTLSAPANAHDIISVASAENTFFEARVFEVDQLDDPVPYMEMTGAELPPTEGDSDPLALPTGDALGCSAGDFTGFPDGHTALIQRGVCPFADKYVNAANAGATGVVIFNNVPGVFAGTIADAGIEGVWSAGISQSDGQALAALVDDGEEVVLGFTDRRETTANPNGGLVSSFSSYGQDVELEFGPSVLAPGGLIVSTYPLASGGYATLSGTSMAAPHVAGAAALLLEEMPDLDPFDVRDRLQNTAEPVLWNGNPSLGELEFVFRQGAGMIQIDQAATSAQSVVPGQIALGDADATTTTVTLANSGEADVTYSIGEEATMSTAIITYTVPGFLPAEGVVDAPGSVTVPAGGSAEVEVTFTTPAWGVPNHQYGGYVTFTPDSEDASTLRVPYVGYDGDYAGEMGLYGWWNAVTDEEGQLIGVTFVDVEPQLKRIGRDGSLVDVPRNHSFQPRRGDYPVIDAFFGHYPQEMRVYANNQATGESYHVMQEEYLPRSPWVGETWAFPWAGVTVDDALVPGGTYRLEVQVLRAMGDPDNPEHWESWESPTFRLANPGGPPPGRGR